jgi:hypothetical protein
MAIVYDDLVKWFDSYFGAFNQNAGSLAGAVKMKKYFTDDFEFWPYNMVGPKPLPREGLLMTMVHPGLHEHLTPLEYIIDLKKLIVVVQFRLQFSDQPSGKVWPPKLASAHYYLILKGNNEPQIKKILYFMELRPPEESGYRDLWTKYRQKDLADNKELVDQLK